MNLKQLMTEFCECQGIANIEPDTKGRYLIEADQYNSHCFYRTGMVYLQTDLGALPDDTYQQDQLVMRLLSAAWAQQVAIPETLSIDDQRNVVSLHRQMPISHLMPDNFEEAVASFFDAVEYVQAGFIA